MNLKYLFVIAAGLMIATQAQAMGERADESQMQRGRGQEQGYNTTSTNAMSTQGGGAGTIQEEQGMGGRSGGQNSPGSL